MQYLITNVCGTFKTGVKNGKKVLHFRRTGALSASAIGDIFTAYLYQ